MTIGSPSAERDGYPVQSGSAFDVTKGKRVRSQP